MNHLPSPSSRKRGFALILVISLVVLLTFLITAFLMRGIQGRQISRAQASHYRSDSLAHSALQTVTGDLMRELEIGSVAEVGAGGQTIYLPKNRADQFPSKNLSTSQKSLLKVSRFNVPFAQKLNPPSGGGFVNEPISLKSDESDIKGRKFPLEQWNRPQFQQGDNILDQAPDWILVSRKGLRGSNDSNNLRQMSDVSSNNPEYVIGRYAFVVYDQGGLLNVNECGAPSLVDEDFKARRGGISQIDLSSLPGMGSGAGLADWRWRSVIGGISEFKKNRFEGKKYCDRVSFGDRGFLSRRELLKYAQKFPEQINPASLKYFTAFHRSLDVPSVIPDKKRPKTSAENLAVGQDNAINPSVFSVKDPSGNLVVKRRFPLNRLSMLEKGTDAAQIEKYFGLKKASAAQTWVYSHGNSAKILRLSEVASLGREPDFFETLKGAIWVGSLGKILVPSASNSATSVDPYHQYTDNQIMAIGLNIIDQWDQDSYPMRVRFDADEIYGTENLPYLYRIMDQVLRVGGAGGTEVRSYFRPEIWNPHQSPGTRTAQGPTRIRFVGDGTGYFYFHTPAPAVPSATRTLKDTDPGVSCDISINNYCQEPTPLLKSNATATGDDVPGAPYQSLGLFLGEVTAADPTQYNIALSIFQSKISFKLQYQIGSEWITYNQMENVDTPGTGGVAPFTAEDNTAAILRSRGDPRTSRFGHIVGVLSAAVWAWDVNRYGPEFGSTIRPARSNGCSAYYPVSSFYPASYPGWTFGEAWAWLTSTFYWGPLSENSSTSVTRYKDPDGTLRGADGIYAKLTTNDGYPQMTGNLESRPVILNRAFRSVGEMGYAFRDLPWKSLDFFTENSADTALLDYFCLQESDDNAMVSHQIALNTPYEEILTARLMGASKKESDLSQVLSKTQAQAISKQMIADLQNEAVGPLQNRSELVTRLISKIDYGNDTDNIIKAQREAALRALAHDADSRTWNLMIDLVAQTGSYPGSSRKLSEFDVRGQARYWMHLSIDRFTGKILDTRCEKIVD